MVKLFASHTGNSKAVSSVTLVVFVFQTLVDLDVRCFAFEEYPCWC